MQAYVFASRFPALVALSSFDPRATTKEINVPHTNFHGKPAGRRLACPSAVFLEPLSRRADRARPSLLITCVLHFGNDVCVVDPSRATDDIGTTTYGTLPTEFTNASGGGGDGGGGGGARRAKKMTSPLVDTSSSPRHPQPSSQMKPSMGDDRGHQSSLFVSGDTVSQALQLSRELATTTSHRTTTATPLQEPHRLTTSNNEDRHKTGVDRALPVCAATESFMWQLRSAAEKAVPFWATLKGSDATTPHGQSIPVWMASALAKLTDPPTFVRGHPAGIDNAEAPLLRPGDLHCLVEDGLVFAASTRCAVAGYPPMYISFGRYFWADMLLGSTAKEKRHDDVAAAACNERQHSPVSLLARRGTIEGSLIELFAGAPGRWPVPATPEGADVPPETTARHRFTSCDDDDGDNRHLFRAFRPGDDHR